MFTEFYKEKMKQNILEKATLTKTKIKEMKNHKKQTKAQEKIMLLEEFEKTLDQLEWKESNKYKVVEERDRAH